MALKALVGQKIMNDVIRRTARVHNKSSDKQEWRVLLLDQQSMRMISACTKMQDLTAEGITIVETIDKRREPLPAMEAIYLITPLEKSVRQLIKDFQSQEKVQYKCAHVFFTEACPDPLFAQLSSSKAAKFIETCREIDMSFIPLESQVFTLDRRESFGCLFNPRMSRSRDNELERMAEQIATLCSTLGEYPSIRYKVDESDLNSDFALMVKDKLDAYKADEPTMGQGAEKAKSQLIILDRGFDTTSVLLHELTFQAMAYDLLPINRDVYQFKTSQGVLKEVVLDESDDLWVDMRHQHIADVTQNITKNLKKFSQEKRIQGDGKSIRDLSQMIKQMPQHQKELNKFVTHMSLAEECMNLYSGYIDKLCKVEQDLAMGEDAEGERIRDHMRNIVPILLEEKIPTKDKIRIILLYIQCKKGISEENLNKLMQHAQIPRREKEMITNFAYLGCNVILGESSGGGWELSRKNRVNEQTYQMSRWTPQLKDIMEDAIDGKLNNSQFPYLSEQKKGFGLPKAPLSARYGKWHQDRSKQDFQKNVPRLIIFVLGGATYSELRCAYEVTKDRKWEVIVGGSHIIAPSHFLDDIKGLSTSMSSHED